MRILFGKMAGLALATMVFLSGAAEAADKLAQAFGTEPSMWGLQLSPSGTKLSFLQMHSSGLPIAVVIDMATGKAHVALASIPKTADVTWCGWANDERLLCGMRGVNENFSSKFYATRLVAVNFDGSKSRILFGKELNKTFFQFTDRVVDWLVDDPRHVLVEMPGQGGYGVERLDVYSGSTIPVTPVKRGVYTWASDGHGNVRLYQMATTKDEAWYVRPTPRGDWQKLQRAALKDLVKYSPVGFGPKGEELYYMKPYKGHEALWVHDLATKGDDQVVFSNDKVDVSGTMTLGKYDRIVGAYYVTDRPHRKFFDAKVEKIIHQVQASFPDKEISIITASWDESVYILHVGGPTDPGAYYWLNTRKNAMAKLRDYQPLLAGKALSPVKAYDYKAADGTSIPGYLTLPKGMAKNLPAVIMPHGGPEARDSLEYNWLAQYMAAKGYAVLQSNFRGSGGYGEEWEGKGGFRNWKTAIGDILDGAKALIADGTVDPKRVCIFGWSYGGYAALMSAIQDPRLFKCVISVAGVTDPKSLIGDAKSFVGSQASEEFIGKDSENLAEGSPVLRAEEIRAPVLLLHGKKDVTVDYDHSVDMERALKRAGKSVQLVSYAEADHQIYLNADRIDLLTRIGKFLKKNIGD